MNRLMAAVMLVTGMAASLAAQEPVSQEEVRTIASLRRGEYAVIRAEVYRIPDEDEIRVRDETGRIEVYLGAVGNARDLVTVGDIVTIVGWVDDDWFDVPRELYASRIILADGTTIELERERSWD